jgi:hypothetical protein
MQLEAGKRYTDRRGRVYGPLVKDGVFYAEQVNCPLWSSNGQINHDSLDMDLVAEYVEPVQPEYRMLQDGETVLPDDEYLGYSEKWEKVPSSGNVFNSWLYWPHRRLVEPAPVESPDDWVIQDRVPARAGIDQECWSNWRPGAWSTVSEGQVCYGRKMRHGEADHMGDTLSLRCRRKDLPPVPPKTRTVVLQEWICWDDDYPEAVVTQWFSTDPSVNAGLAAEYGHAVATGETRTVEIPVT